MVILHTHKFKIMSQQNQGPTLNFKPINVDEVREGISDSADIAILRQTVDSVYPGARGGNSLSSALFEDNSFGEGQTYSNDRVCIIKVPKGTTAAQVQTKINALENPRIYRIMSYDYKDCMTGEQKQAIDNGISSLSYDDYRDRLLAINPETEEPLMKNGRTFYRALFFSTTPVEDVDQRGETHVESTASALEIGSSREQVDQEMAAQHFDRTAQ
jgi:hypothetical protein